MNKYLSAALLVAGAVACAAADAPTLQDARLRWLKGNYEEALSLYEDLAKDPKTQDRRRRRPEPRPGERRRIRQGAGRRRGRPEGRAEGRAGCWPARPSCSTCAAAGTTPRRPPTRPWTPPSRRSWPISWPAGSAARSTATAATWPRPTPSSAGSSAPTPSAATRTTTSRTPTSCCSSAWPARENARWHNLSDQFEFILQTLYVDAEKEADKAKEPLWPAEYQAGALLLEKYNQPEALDAFDKALAINPRAAEALVGKGEAALQKLEIKQADGFADRALKINPRLPDALLLKADVQLAGGDISRRPGRRWRRRWPSTRATNTPWPAWPPASRCMKKKDDYDAVVKAVEKNNPKPAVFYYDLGERLEDRRYFDEAETCYKKAAELRPMHAGAGRHARPAVHAAGPRGGGRPAARQGLRGRPVQRPRRQHAQGAEAPQGLRDAQDRPFRAPLRPEERRRPGPLHGRLPGADLRRPVRRSSSTSRRGRS